MSTDCNTPDEFDFDGAPPAGATLTDPQPGRDGKGDGGYDDFDDEVEIKTIDKPTKARGSFSKPRKYSKDGDEGVVIDFTASEPEHVAGFEAVLFLTLKGDRKKSARGVEDLGKLCKKLGIPATGKASELLQQVAERADDAEVEFKLNPGKQGGVFVNL